MAKKSAGNPKRAKATKAQAKAAKLPKVKTSVRAGDTTGSEVLSSGQFSGFFHS